MTPYDGLILIFGGFVFFLLLLAVPVPFALGLTALVAIAVSGTVPLAAVPIKIVNSMDSFLLIAVPFFILSAELLNTSQITMRIFRFADSLVGHVRGGLGHVNVVGSMIFSGMSGSAVADVAGMGAIEVKAMLDAKYDRAFVAAVTASSAVVGPIIPPSIPAILYGSIAEVSVGKLFVGGIVPGTMMGFAMMGAVWWMSWRRNYPAGARVPLREIGVRFLAALPSLLAPVIIIGGMMAGIFTPTEASVVAVLYSVVLAVVVYRELSFAALVGCLARASTTMGVFLMMLATGSVIGLLATRQRLPVLIEDWIRGLGDQPPRGPPPHPPRAAHPRLLLRRDGDPGDDDAVPGSPGRLARAGPRPLRHRDDLHGDDRRHHAALRRPHVHRLPAHRRDHDGVRAGLHPLPGRAAGHRALRRVRPPDRALPGQPVLTPPPMEGLDPELPATPTSLKQWVLASGMLVLVILASLQVFARYLFDRPLAWSEEGVRYVMTWTAFLAAAWSVRDREHITVEIIMPWLGPRLRRVVETLRWLLVAVFCLVLLPSSIRTTLDVHAQLGVAIEIPLSFIFASLPIGLALMAWYALRLAVQGWRVR